jgi:TonB family protein
MILSKAVGSSFLLLGLYFAALPVFAQTLRNEKADKPQTTPIQLDAANQPVILSRVELEFPPDAKEARVSGAVRVEVLVNEKGEVYEAKVLDGHPWFFLSALDAVVQWKFKPMLANGEPKPFLTTVWIGFNSRLQTLRNEMADKPQTTPVATSSLDSVVLSRVELEYPSWAKAVKITGTVQVVITVNEKGEVYEARAVSGHPWFIQPALDAAVQWKFKPVLVNGEPKPFSTVIRFTH